MMAHGVNAVHQYRIIYSSINLQYTATMCGFIQRVTDSPHVKVILAIVGLDLDLPGGSFRPRGMLPGMIIEDAGEYRVIDAVWWFSLQKGPKGWEPNPRATTFNAHDMSLPTWEDPVKTHRGIVIADAIGESNPVPGYKTKKDQYLMESGAGLILGALYKEWETPEGPIYSAAVITCDPHPLFSQYHKKSAPLFLPPDEEVLRQWLSKRVDDPPYLQGDLFDHHLPYDLTVSKVKTYARGELLDGPWLLEAYGYGETQAK